MTAKDLILKILSLDYVRGGKALAKVIEYAGEAIEATRDALTRVQDRLHAGASDAQLERLLDEPVTTVASHTKGKATPTHVAKAASGATVRQAGVPSKSRTPPTKRKTPGN